MRPVLAFETVIQALGANKPPTGDQELSNLD